MSGRPEKMCLYDNMAENRMRKPLQMGKAAANRESRCKWGKLLQIP